MINKLLVKIFNKASSFLQLAIAYVRLNLAAQLEYRGAFLSQMLAMFLNDCTWLTFWILFFTRFPVLRGWTIQDLVTIWAITAAGFGIAYAVCGNVQKLPALITKGQLDAWMLYPRALLPHILLGRMSATACGDGIFGYLAYVFIVHPDLKHFLLFVLLTLSSAFVFIGFGIVAGSLGFYLGNAEVLAEQWFGSTITFSTYPATLFEGVIKLILFTLIPAGFISYLPASALRNMSWLEASYCLAGALSIVSVGTFVFYHGLARYESGSLMEMRG